MKKIITLLFIVSVTYGRAQTPNELKTFHITSPHTSFPDTGRAAGHIYKNILYDAATHYSDSKVLIIVPKKLRAKKKVDLIFWFHGWNNNIDSAAIRYSLIRQFAASGLNAVLVLAETAKDAPDSYGGRLEQKGVFKNLVVDVLSGLKKEKIIRTSCNPGNILLAGHSGAYRVIANILQNGKLPVQETILFDALYAETDKFLNWLNADKANRFINIYTDHGGTDNETKDMIKQMILQNISFDTLEESNLKPQQINTIRIIVIHSLREHNDIINDPDNFGLFISNSPFLHTIR